MSINHNVSLVYTSPTGSPHAVRNVDEIIALLEATDSAYWKRGSGDARLNVENDPLRRELTIMCRKSLGYHFLYSQDTGGERNKRLTHIPLASYNLDGRSSLFLGGSFFLFPQAFFLSPTQAWDVIRAFVSDGVMSPKVIWEEHPIGMESDDVYGEPY